MMRYLKFFICLLAIPLPLPIFAQIANVYVEGNGGIYAYDVASNGELTMIKGSPFPGSATAPETVMVGNGRYLFGVSNGTVSKLNPVTTNIDTFLIETNGALKLVRTTNVARFDTHGAIKLNTLFLDKTGVTLYAGIYDGNTNPYLSFNIEESTGELNYTGQVPGNPILPYPLKLTANNRFAYGAVCDGANDRALLGYARQSDGVLIVGKSGSLPEAAPGDVFCPLAATGAADPANHVAFAMLPELDHPLGSPAGAMQLATYTADSEGRLTTTSTYKNMPTVAVGSVSNLNTAPSGKLLAVGGSAGLQIFNFHGANPITPYTGLIGIGQYNQFRWDNYNHLYAINNDTGHLHIFTITPTKVSEAPGSPFTIPGGEGYGGAYAFTVQNLPRNPPQ
jgi:6-phosphogluconolactonase (cycloisomerase 2 family)